MFNINCVPEKIRDDIRMEAEVFTTLLVQRGDSTDSIIKDINLLIKEITKTYEQCFQDGELAASTKTLLNLHRHKFFVDIIRYKLTPLPQNYHVKDIVKDSRKLAENIYGKFPE